ncbi:MAG TPA: potassium channel family protein [Thermomicrobiales bacterium]|nr:potassium channel family protein [Thermomicrobiales bacterium]
MIPHDRLPSLGPLRLPDDSPRRALIRRGILAIGLILVITSILYVDRDGLRDNAHPDHPPGLVDIFYFNVVSLTTVGYGDITPVTDVSRLINALILTPIRIFLWVLFLGTAYEVSMLRLRYREERHMKELHERLKNHVIICGYGSKGHAIVDELLAHGQQPDNIVVIDQSEAACAEAAKAGLVVMRGDASQEAILEAAAIAQARWILIAPDRDDAAALICLTVRNLNQTIHVVASARQEENIKLLYGAGANLVVAPAVTGGRLMASAVRQQVVPQVLEDMIMFGEGLSLSEHNVTSADVGQRIDELPGMERTMPLALKRDGVIYPFHRLNEMQLQFGDVLVVVIDMAQP